jgi:uncharacterized protein YlxW (UPF0749 family)
MSKKGTFVITMFCVFFGISMGMVLENPNTNMDVGGTTSIQRIEELLAEKETLARRRENLLSKARSYEEVISTHEEEAAKSNYRGEELLEELKNARFLAGLVDLQGPGIEITLNDRKRDTIIYSNPTLLSYYIVHDIDLLNIVNELRSAGAEAISINDVRIIATSRISCGGPTISIGKEQRFAPPFIIRAIGDPDKMMDYFIKRKDSVYHDLLFWGLEFNIKKLDNVLIPRYLGDIKFYYAMKSR